MHPTCSGRRPPHAGTPSTRLTRIRNFPHPARHAPTPGRPHMQATPLPIPHVAPHVQPCLSRASHASGPLPPSRTPCPRPDAWPSSYAGHAPGHPHVTLPCPAALICKPRTCPSLMPCPRTRPHSFSGHPPGRPRMQVMHPPIPHAMLTCLDALACMPRARPSLVPHPNTRAAWQPLIAHHASTHPSCESYSPSFTLHGSTLGLSLPNRMRFTFFLLLANLKVNPLLLVKCVFYMPISHQDQPSASTTVCHKLKLLALLPNADQHPLSSSLIACSFSL